MEKLKFDTSKHQGKTLAEVAKTKGGRPKGSTAENNRTISKTFKINEKESEELQSRADEIGMSVSQYIRYVLFIK